MNRPQLAGAIVLVLLGTPLLCFLLMLGELSLVDHRTHLATPQLPEMTKKLIDIQVDLAKLFIGFATSLIGGLAYYIKSRHTDFDRFSLLAMISLIAAFAASIASIYFGQIWISAIVTELDGQYFSPSNSEVSIPQTAEYITFLAALIWGVIGVVIQEHHRIGASR